MHSIDLILKCPPIVFIVKCAANLLSCYSQCTVRYFLLNTSEDSSKVPCAVKDVCKRARLFFTVGKFDILSRWFMYRESSLCMCFLDILLPILQDETLRVFSCIHPLVLSTFSLV